MAGVVQLYQQLSTPLVRALETRPGRSLQFLFRFVAELRPSLALCGSMYTMLLAVHGAEQDVRGQRLLEDNITSCLASSTCDSLHLLDLSNPQGTWRTDVRDDPLFSMIISGIATLGFILSLATMIPFLTFRTPEEFASGELIDTALCFHINVFNQKTMVSIAKNILLVAIVISDVVIIAAQPDATFVLQVLIIPLLVAYVSVIFLFPYAKYNQMSYDRFVALFKQDGSLAPAAEMTPDQIFIKLLVHNSKQRVLDEVSRQAMADLKTADELSTVVPPSLSTSTAWSSISSAPRVGPKSQGL